MRRLILASAERLMTRGWHRTLNAWLRAMPDDLSLADPWLAYWRGVALAPFDAAATHAHLERADRQFVLRPALFETPRRELFGGETRGKSHAVVWRIWPGDRVGQGAYRDRGSLVGKRQGSSGS